MPAPAAGVQVRYEKQTEMESLTLFLPLLEHERDRLQAKKEKLECQIKLLEESVTASETRANTAIDRNRSLQKELQTVMSLFQIKKEELETQEKKIKMLQKEAAEAKALQEHLTRMTTHLSEMEREIRLYQQQMKMLEKKNLMHTASLEKKERKFQVRREAERKAMREELQRVAAALKQHEKEELEWRKKAQALSSALAKSELSKGTLRKKLTREQQRTALSRDTDCCHLQVGCDLQSTYVSLKRTPNVLWCNSWSLKRHLLALTSRGPFVPCDPFSHPVCRWNISRRAGRHVVGIRRGRVCSLCMGLPRSSSRRVLQCLG